MKNLILLFLFISSPISILACTCIEHASFCSLLQNRLYFDRGGLVCIAEPTGNVSQNGPVDVAEMKLINLLYGEIQPGNGQYLNSDSTFWLLSLGGAACYKDVIGFKNAGEQFVMAPTYAQLFNFPTYSEQMGYSLFLCQTDVFKYENVMAEIPAEEAQLPDLFDSCLYGESFNYNDLTITCPGNTFLGTFNCLNIDNVPPLINSIEEAMAPPYYIQIEGDTSIYPWGLQVTTEDDGVIFFCEDDPRIINREIIFFTGPGGFEGTTEIARCSFTIETIVDVTPIDFIAPPDTEINCGELSTTPPDEVTFIGYDCFAFDQTNAFFSDQVRVDNDNTSYIRTWKTTDACGNFSEPQEQIITYNCERPNSEITIICPDDTFLGTFDCTNIHQTPEHPGRITEALDSPYNIQIEGDLTPYIRVTTFDDGAVFYCESDSRSVNRNIIFYMDINLNFVYDIGEEIGGCNFTIETVADVTPLVVNIPSDIELPCGVEPNPINTGSAGFENECPILIDPGPTFYNDEIIINGSTKTILRSWSANDPCGNTSEPQVQTITINCGPDCIPPNTGTFNCGN